MKLIIPEPIARDGIASGVLTRLPDGSYRFTDPERADIRVEAGRQTAVVGTPDEIAKLADWGAPWLMN